MKPHLADADVTLYQGDCVEVLRELPDESVHMCVTSPPFYGLRDYGTGTWDGGDADHEHETVAARNGRGGSGAPGKQTADAFPSELPVAECSCGARRVDQQIGLEETPEQWVERLVDVFREVRRVLRKDGTLWLEIGDSYAARGNTGGMNSLSQPQQAIGERGWRSAPPGYKNKDLIGAPWMLAFALRADGWYLRSEIIWARPNPMPESVTDRPTKSHSTIFLLTKQPRYFFDQEAVREPHKPESVEHHTRYAGKHYATDKMQAQKDAAGKMRWEHRVPNPAGRNIRSVWNIATQPFAEAHFATFPEELVRRCIRAGTSEKGCCPECGAPLVRETEPVGDYAEALKKPTWASGGLERGAGANKTVSTTRTTGWTPTCGDDCELIKAGKFIPVACTVLDPFMGSGTTALVARKLGRRAIGIDLSAEYLSMAARRLSQQSLFA